MLAQAQTRYRLRRSRVTRELVAPDSLDGNDVPLLQKRAGGIGFIQKCQRIQCDRAPISTDERQPRPTYMTGDRLRVEAPIGGIGILRGARRA